MHNPKLVRPAVAECREFVFQTFCRREMSRIVAIFMTLYGARILRKTSIHCREMLSQNVANVAPGLASLK